MRFASLTVVAVLASAGMSLAQSSPLQFSFKYDNLDGQYSAGTQTFTANASNAQSQITSSGTVTKNVGPEVTTYFDAGFVANSVPSNFQLNLNVANVLGSIASGFGGLTITDSVGNTITANITGDRLADPNTGWRQFNFFVAFNGNLTNVQFNQRPGGTDTIWRGANGGQFDWTSLPGGPIFDGALVQLFIYTGGGFFGSQDWGFQAGNPLRPAVPVGLTGQLIPAPGALALVGMGGLIAARRRRA